MSDHAGYPEIGKRLRRAEGHLHSILAMLDGGRGCLEIAQQLQAVEKAIASAKRVLVQDHIDHCLEQAVREGTRDPDDAIREFKQITKYL